MRLLKLTRYSEWWEYKLVPLVTVGYATVLYNQQNIISEIPTMLFILGTIIVGAIYVSIINDITDIDEDFKASKNNRMATLTVSGRYSLVGICLILAAGASYFIYPDIAALCCYILAYVVFTMYSVPPFRLKKRGILGVLCDAMGAHFFPALVMAIHLTTSSARQHNLVWITAIGIWSLAYGLRGILWHQFYDRDNDIRSDTRTFAVSADPQRFRVQELAIFTIELLAVAVVISFIMNLWIAIGAVVYLLLVLMRKFVLKYDTTLIICPQGRPYQLLMNDYYFVFLPISLLVTFAMTNAYGWIILLLHVLLFPQKTLFVMKDFLYFMQKIRHSI